MSNSLNSFSLHASRQYLTGTGMPPDVHVLILLWLILNGCVVTHFTTCRHQAGVLTRPQQPHTASAGAHA